MGDVSEIRILLVIGSFMACFTIVTALGLQAFSQVTPTYRQLDIPEYMDANQLLNITASMEKGINGSAALQSFNLNGIDFQIVCDTEAVQFTHVVYSWGGFWVTMHNMIWYNDTGARISQDTFLGEYLFLDELDGYENGASFTLSCSDISMKAGLSYNSALYLSYKDAYQYGNVILWSGLGWQEAGTLANAWNLIGAMFWFQQPEIHPAINFLVHVPMYISIGYVSFILILRAIGAVFGGGGA